MLFWLLILLLTSSTGRVETKAGAVGWIPNIELLASMGVLAIMEPDMADITGADKLSDTKMKKYKVENNMLGYLLYYNTD